MAYDTVIWEQDDGVGRLTLNRPETLNAIDRAMLDTLDEMESARQLYASLGFEEVAPYYFNPIPGAHYLKADLD